MNEAVPSVVAIDIGTHTVSVLTGKVHAPDNSQVIGIATARNRGMNKGKIVSLDKVITAIKNAVQEAEDMAVEYRLAYGGAVNVKEVEEDDYVDVEDNYEDDGDWMDADALASAGFGTDEDYGSYGGDEW